MYMLYVCVFGGGGQRERESVGGGERERERDGGERQTECLLLFI